MADEKWSFEPPVRIELDGDDEFIEQFDFYDYEERVWDEEQQMWIDSETGEEWCDHKWEGYTTQYGTRAYRCSECCANTG